MDSEQIIDAIRARSITGNSGLEQVRARALKQTHVRLQRKGDQPNRIHKESLHGIRALKKHTNEELPGAQCKPSRLYGFWSYIENLLHDK